MMDEPAIAFQAYHDDGPGNLTPTRVVIHATCPNIGYPGASAAGQARSNAHYFTDPNSGGSAHYVVDIVEEYHCAPDSHICWHAPPNPRSIGIEICSEGGDYPKSYTREQWLSPEVFPALRRAAQRTAELCVRYGIPPIRIGPPELLAGRRGVCGHIDVSRAWHQSDHSDPGPCFPWPEFMAMVTGAGISAPQRQQHREGSEVMNHRVLGSGVLPLICPVGKSSSVVSRAWVSAIVDGPDSGHVNFFFQNDTAGIASVAHDIAFADGHSQRTPVAVPDGTTMIRVEYSFKLGGTVCLETEAKPV